MTAVEAAVEANERGAIAFAFAWPGACGWGPSEDAALERLRADLVVTGGWLAGHGLVPEPYDPVPADPAVDVIERVAATGDPRECDSEGLFAVDRRPYGGADVTRTRELLAASRADLRALVGDPGRPALDHRLVAGRRTVREVLDHVAIAEHWYLTRVEAPYEPPGSYRAYPEGTFERLRAIRGDVERFLAAVEGAPAASRDRRWVRDGEGWTVRKVLRRLIWHELLHYKQLGRLLPKVEAAAEG